MDNETISIYAGFFSGIVIAGLFNPWDRALYLSVKNATPFLYSGHFSNPYQGFSQAILQRTFSCGLYYILQDNAQRWLARTQFDETTRGAQMLVGLSAGAINGSLLNQLATVKHQSWGKEGAKFLETAFLMYRRGGIRPFFKGNLATTQRDTIFGVVYETGRHSLKQYVLNRQDQSPLALPISIACDCTAAAFGTIMSSPLNYVRNMKYASSASCKAPSTRKILVSLWKQALRHHKEGLAKGDPPLKALCRGFGYLQDRLRIGWGTARVAVGMALGQTLFDATKRCLSANFGNSEATE